MEEQVSSSKFLAEFPINLINRFSFVCIYFTNILYCFTTDVSLLQLILYGMIYVSLSNAWSFTGLLCYSIQKIM